MAEHRNAHVEIGKAENGQPSIKVDGVEINNLVGRDVSLRFVADDLLGHWELTVSYLEPVVTADVEATVVDGQASEIAEYAKYTVREDEWLRDSK